MLTTTQAAALLGIESAMARRYCHEGRLAATQVGGRWITTVEAVEAFRPTMKKAGRPRKDTRMKTIQEGMIVTENYILGPRDVKVITVNRAMNYAVIQFRELDKTPHERNIYTVTLDKLQPKD